MGQAKRRGTFEQRQAEAVEGDRVAAYFAQLDAERQRIWQARARQQKEMVGVQAPKIYRQRSHLLPSLALVAMASLGGSNDN